MVEHKRGNWCIQLLLVITTAQHPFIKVVECYCEVAVSPTWHSQTFVPLDSVVSMTCRSTIDCRISCLAWKIKLPERQVIDTFSNSISKEILNKRGFYKVETGSPTAIQLIVNKTKLNDSKTELKCENVLSGEIEEETMFFIFEPSPIMLTISEVTDFLAPQVIHLDWSHLNLAGEGDDDISLNYTLKAVPATDDVLTQAITLLQSNYVFTAPDNAPPCEVYNFSVAATPVGATYTGDGCTTSVSSLVLSRMLPSLPDISMLEASLKHSLKKLPTGKFLLNVSFIAADTCVTYPVTNYTLYVREESINNSSVIKLSSPTSGALTVRDLHEDRLYVFSVVVSNAVGEVYTNAREIYTTDVQSVSVAPNGDHNGIRVQCTFVRGSNALGCMVTLVDDYDGVSVNLTRSKDSLCIEAEFKLPGIVSDYGAVWGYDIEEDGSVGSVAVPGTIAHENISTACEPTAGGLSPVEVLPLWTIVLVGLAMVLLLATLVAISSLVYYKVKPRRSRDPIVLYSEPYSPSECDGKPENILGEENEKLREAMPHYDTIMSEPKEERLHTNMCDDESGRHINTLHQDHLLREHPKRRPAQQDSTNASRELRREQEHVYFQLESPPDQPRAQPKSQLRYSPTCTDDEVIPESAYDDQIDLPIYQEVVDLPSSHTSFHNPLGDTEPEICHTDSEARQYDSLNTEYDDTVPPPTYQEVSKRSSSTMYPPTPGDLPKSVYDTLT